MAKRFTDTTKWKRPWFQALSRDAKLVWMFLCDDCDHAGIWIADFAVMSLRLGMKVDEPKLRELVGDKLVKIDDDKYFIPSFFEFQYGDSDAGFRAKQGAMKQLIKFNLIEESTNSLKDLSNSYLSLSEAQGIGTSKSTSTGKEGCGEKTVSAADLEAEYQNYPRKKGKTAGMAIAKREVKTKADLESLRLAISRYRQDCEREKKEETFIMHFSTFMGKWRDWTDPNHGKSESFNAPLTDAEAKERALFAKEGA